MSSNLADTSARIERIRAVVNEDFERISKSEDPFVILNIDPDIRWEEAAARYERYERFYRAENFQRLGDMDLTRKAMDIRRAVGRAIVEVQGLTVGEPVGAPPSEVDEVDPDERAMGDIYFRDGLTYLRLGDLDTARDAFRKSHDSDPGRGIALAYLGYTSFRRRIHDEELQQETRETMAAAIRLAPTDPDVHVLAARFHLKIGDTDAARAAIQRVERLEPAHPKLGKLHARLQVAITRNGA